MKAKSLASVLLLAFVVVSIVFAIRKIGPGSPTGQPQTATSQDAAQASESLVGLSAKLTEAKFTAVYFHAPHRCPTCRKIESFAHAALTPEIESGAIAWQIADYTSASNAELVNRFKVFASTVVLVEVQDGEVVRWKNLEEVWNHTSEQADFTVFMNQAWSEFKAS